MCTGPLANPEVQRLAQRVAKVEITDVSKDALRTPEEELKSFASRLSWWLSLPQGIKGTFSAETFEALKKLTVEDANHCFPYLQPAFQILAQNAAARQPGSKVCTDVLSDQTVRATAATVIAEIRNAPPVYSLLHSPAPSADAFYRRFADKLVSALGSPAASLAVARVQSALSNVVQAVNCFPGLGELIGLVREQERDAAAAAAKTKADAVLEAKKPENSCLPLIRNTPS